MFRGFGLLILIVLMAPAGIAGARAEAVPVSPASVSSDPIRIGLLPTIATLSLLKLYDPMRQHLQESLGRPVELYTAANFRAYLDDVRDGAFDVIVAAPHYGVIAYDQGYIPLFHYKLELRPLVIVPKGSDLRDARQLRGKRVLTADRLTALSVVAETWLRRDYGMEAGRDYTLVDASNHATAIRAVAIGDADAAISGRSPLQQVPEDIREKVETIACRLSVPHQFTMAHRRLGPEVIAAIRTALAGFEYSERGKAFFKAGGFLGFMPLEPGDIERARPYAEVVGRVPVDGGVK
jgi:phosphonate transport system substrate-binding protein